MKSALLILFVPERCSHNRLINRLFAPTIVQKLRDPENVVEVTATVEAEWKQLQEDRRLLRKMFINNSKVRLINFLVIISSDRMRSS